MANMQTKCTQVAARDTRGAPKASPKCPPQGSTKSPTGAHRSPRRPQSHPKNPKWCPRLSNGAQGTQKRFKQKRTWKTQYYRRKSLPGGENVNKHMEKPHLRNSRFCVFSLQPTKTRRILRVRVSAVPPATGFEAGGPCHQARGNPLPPPPPAAQLAFQQQCRCAAATPPLSCSSKLKV